MRTPLLKCVVSLVVCTCLLTVGARASQDASGSLTPSQLEIERQRVRLGSADVEERRDSVTRLGAMRRAEASRAALAGLKDDLPIVRATSATAILSLPAEESAAYLLPLLSDKDEFVRREAAYALGTMRSASAVVPLSELLQTDKIDEVRGAAAVALGQISNEAAAAPLINVLVGQAAQGKKKKARKEQNPFVLRSAARALGQLGSRAGVPVLVGILQDEKLEADLRREAAIALGAIGEQAALPALRNATSASDPHLAHAADAAIKSILKTATR